ncbi:MAG: carboxypeptidase-like regulatory domain-containing protein [Thermoguttaceae bacterium]
MANQYGPWATLIDAGGNPQLSSFWRRRLTMLVPTSQTSPALSRRNLLWLGVAAMLTVFLPTLRSASVIADDQKPAAPVARPATADALIEKPKDKRIATITGRVMREDTGQPLAEAVVRAAVPVTDMRFIRCKPNHPRYETKTDERGQYRLAVPVDAPNTHVSLDAFCQGFQSAAGLYMQGNRDSKVTVSPNGTASCDFKLQESMYVAGRLVNEDGEGVEDAMTSASIQTAKGNGGVTRVLTGKDGEFQIFDYPKEPPKNSKGRLMFTHPKYCTIIITDVYALPEKQRRNLQIAAAKGKAIQGRILDADGKPAADVMVEVNFAKERKATISGRDGSFGLYGLPDGECTMTAHALNTRQKASQSITLNKDRNDLVLKMSRIETSHKSQPVMLLGMKLVDVNPALKGEYDLFDDRGVIVLDPGPNHARLHIGNLVEGDCFWMVGNTQIRNIEDFVVQLLRNVQRRSDGSGNCRVVYSLRRIDILGTNTQYIELKADDLKELEAVARQFTTKKP